MAFAQVHNLTLAGSSLLSMPCGRFVLLSDWSQPSFLKDSFPVKITVNQAVA